MKLTRILVLLLLPIAQVCAADAIAVSLATATKGGGFQLFGDTLADVVNSGDEGVTVTTVATSGSSQNLEMLEAGKVDAGLVEGNAARIALDGVERPVAALKVLAVMYPNPGMFVVRGDSAHQVIDDLKGKPIAFGTRASGLRILAGDVLDGLGLAADRDFQQIILDKAGDGPAMVSKGAADALWGAGIGWPGFAKVADGPTGARFIAPTPEQIRQIREKHPHLLEMSVPAGTYTGQSTEIRSVGLWSLILVRDDLDDETAYRLARAIDRGHASLAERLPQGRYTSASNTVANVPMHRLHPGAVRYYREAGYPPASGDIVKITPLGSHDGEFCRYDRALVLEDPDGTRLLYDAGRTVAGADDPRLGKIDVVLVSHMHGDHVGDRRIGSVNTGTCSEPELAVNFIPHTNSLDIAHAKGATIVTGSEMPKFFAKKLEALGGDPKRSRLVRFGGSTTINGVTLTTVPAAHSNGISGAMIGGELGSLLDSAGLTAYAGPPTGYVVTFSNGLKVYLSGDTGITAEQDAVVRGHYGAQLAVINIGDTFTTGPTEAAYVVNRLVQPWAVIPSHANEQATQGGKPIPGTRTAQFSRTAEVPVHLPLSGITMAFDGQGRCHAGCN